MHATGNLLFVRLALLCLLFCFQHCKSIELFCLFVNFNEVKGYFYMADLPLSATRQLTCPFDTISFSPQQMDLSLLIYSEETS